MSDSSTTVRTQGARLARTLATILIAALFVAALAPVATAQDSVSRSNWSPPRTVYIPETGQTLDRLFLDLWRSAGGANAYGYPITPEITLTNGHVVQYLQYARFEYWPEGDEHGNVVKLGNVGEELRPTVVQRSRGPFGGAAQNDAAAEAARMARAWLPLAGKAAKRESSDTYRFVPETGHSVQMGFKAFWEATGEAAYLGHPLTEEYTLDGVTYQVFERGQLAWERGKAPWLVPVGEVLAKRYKLDTAPRPQGDLPIYSDDLFIPPPAPVDDVGAPPPPAGAPRSIVIALSQQMMWAYEGDTVVLSSLVSTGKSGFETPPGTYQILVKKEIEDMEGLIGGEYYDVPQVPDVMYFTDVGHAFHGAYWHNDFGSTRSHGCVNLPLDVAAWLYAWTPIGTTVLIVP
ncbi:MAG: L,D-transpeptidase [Thermomicrobiales bacterium]